MLRSLRRLLVTVLLSLLVLSGFQVAADGSARPRRLARPVLSGHSVPNGAQFTWGPVRGATGFRVAWSAAPYGKWPGTRSYVTRWLPRSARSSTFGVPAVPQSGDHMLGVAYANPIFGQLDARNAKHRLRHSTGWVPVFPAAPDPGSGDPLRVGTYNVMMAINHDPDRVQAVAANISTHGLGVVVLQEATDATAQALVGALGREWSYVPLQNSPEQIIYRSTAYRVTASGTFDVFNAKTPGTPLKTPWARLERVVPSAGSRPVCVVSAHVTENAAKSVMDRKREAGIEAQNMMAGINNQSCAGNPTIIAGDLHYLREPYSDVPGYVEAPPTLVRGGYYDAMAALAKVNIAYGTFNGGNGRTAPAQGAVSAGVSPRADYVMLKGFRGSNAYVNVPNWSFNGLVPSDHNLVYADVTVPLS